MSAKALVAERDGKIIGIGGYYIHQGKAVAFTDNRDMSKRDMIAGAYALMRLLENLKLDIIAAADHSGTPLRHFGFKPIGDAWILEK